MDFNQAKDGALVLVCSGLIYFLKGVLDTLKGMKSSVDTLNIHMAVIVTKTDNHEKRLDKLEGNV